LVEKGCRGSVLKRVKLEMRVDVGRCPKNDAQEARGGLKFGFALSTPPAVKLWRRIRDAGARLVVVH